MNIKVTVCELHNEPDVFVNNWKQLVRHVHRERSQFVILPEMPFSPWFVTTAKFDESQWKKTILAHDHWQARLHELAPATILSSRPIDRDGKRFNEGFSWESEEGYRSIHSKYYLPDEEGVWEASWYQKGDGSFTTHKYRNARLGMLLCTELWAMEQARTYGNTGSHLLVVPRTTERTTLDKWIIGGQAAAIVAGAFCASSNRISSGGEFGGQGWIIGPDGDILGLTSQEQPFISITIDLQRAEEAKTTYPRYIFSTSE